MSSKSGPEKGVITKGVFALEESLKSLESLENGLILFCFPQSGGSLESLNSLESLEMDFSENTLFPNPTYYSACSPEEFCEYFFRVCLGSLH